MAIYKAPKPKRTPWQWLQYLSLRILFPPVLLWDLLKTIFNALLGKKVSKIVLPGQDSDFTSSQIHNPSELNTEDLKHEKHTVITHDKARLDTLEIKHSSLINKAPGVQKYIIYFVGNDCSYEDTIQTMQDDALALKTNVVGFNYRGVSLSTGKLKQKRDLINDGIAQVQRLLDQGVPAANITLKGHSIGGAVATAVARHFHRHKKTVNLFNDRSFSSITNYLAGHIRTSTSPKKGTRSPLRKKILAGLAWPFIKVGVSLVKWEMNADRAYKSLPRKHREYLVLRSPKSMRKGKAIDDEIITHYASMHAALKCDRHHHKSERIKSQQRKMQGAKDGHMDNLQDLKNQFGSTGSEFFRGFVQKAQEHHGINAPAMSA